MTLAPLLYRALPIDHLRSVSAPHSRHDLEKYSNPISLEARGASPLPAPALSATEISRPSSTSTQTSNTATVQQQHQLSQNIHTPPHASPASFSLPGLSALASIASAPSSQLRSFSNHATPSVNYANSSPAPASLAGNAPPVCQNCQTSTTPLWRRDEMGSVLCNACGLFLKLHGRPRPSSLKTDVIKSRNRVKSTAHGQRKKPLEMNGQATSTSEPGSLHFGSHLQRRSSHKLSSGVSDRSHSPISRANTPYMPHDPNIAPQHLFDGVTLNDHAFHASPSLPALHHLNHPSPGSTSSLTDRHLEPPQTYDQLLLFNNQLKTRVSELELICMMRKETEVQLKKQLESACKGEDDLKRHINQLEEQIKDRLHQEGHPAKRTRLSET